MIKQIAYVNHRTYRRCFQFGTAYGIEYDAASIAEILRDIGVKDGIEYTGLAYIIGHGDYREIWVSGSNRPFDNYSIYSRVTRYTRTW